MTTSSQFESRPDDLAFTDSFDAGHPHCICSRCRLPIQEFQVPVRAVSDDGLFEWRYHADCLGLRSLEDDGSDFWDWNDDDKELERTEERDVEIQGFELTDYGSCCACNKIKPNVRNFICVPRRSPIPGTGWGCLQCGLPIGGALAVICDECLESGTEAVFAIDGYPKDKLRIPVDTLSPEPFEHDMRLHESEDAEN